IRLATALDLQPLAADNVAPSLAGMLRSFVARQPAAAIANPRISSFSFWCACTCSLNPFRATEAGPALIDLRISEAVVIGGRNSTFDVLLNGNLQFEQPITSGSATLLKGKFSGTITFTAPTSSQPSPSSRLVTFDV